jgi:hypothetical protein
MGVFPNPTEGGSLVERIDWLFTLLFIPTRTCNRTRCYRLHFVHTRRTRCYKYEKTNDVVVFNDKPVK